ncbi:hypothetical protein AAFC00_007211 [Neodothiora populina]|uniref:Transcription elongation factor Eaf N-terminal domain-containing protein n=1 Tax=Neodothiora populina TaxID=2781224 RepID=A0ABR3PHK0_9PEZI
MAAAAAPATSPRPGQFDIRNISACPIHLGRSALKDTTTSPSGFTSVQYNHKPALSDGRATVTSIDASGAASNNLQSLTIEDGDDEYRYKGSRAQGDHAYILLPDKEGDGYVLEKLDASYHFNLTKAPWESNTQTLAEWYPQVVTADGGADEATELFGEGGGGDADHKDEAAMEGDADTDNPFDFRHYLHISDTPSPQTRPARGGGGGKIGTPSSVASQPSTRTNTPVVRTAKKPTSAFASQEKRLRAKAKAKPKPVVERPQQSQSKRMRMSPEAETEQASRRPAATDIPTVRLDRRASTRVSAPTADTHANNKKPGRRSLTTTTDAPDNGYDEEEEDEEYDEVDDDGDLVLEGDAPSSQRNQRSLGLALSGALGGPRSLQSAASSPASHINSPHARSHARSHLQESHVDTDGEELELDDDDDDEVQDASDGELQTEDEDVQQDMDAMSEAEAVIAADDDQDVDEIHLPSPAQVHRPSVSNAVVTTAAADDDDDLENQMLLALEGGDDDMSGQQQAAESEEESEEE